MKKSFLIRTVVILLLIFVNIGCDQISKKVVRKSIAPNEKIEFFDDSVILTKVENTGAAYSLGSDLSPFAKKIFLQAIPSLVLFVLLINVIVKQDYSLMTVFGFTFIIGGGFGNMIDRVAYGSVTDFLYVDFNFFDTEIFNMADVSILLGTLLILVYTFLGKKNS